MSPDLVRHVMSFVGFGLIAIVSAAEWSESGTLGFFTKLATITFALISIGEMIFAIVESANK